MHGPSTSRRWTRNAGTIFLAVAAAVTAAADVFHLDRDRTIEGRLLGEEAGYYRIRTLEGVISLPIASVREVERGPSVIDEYDQRLAALNADSADEQAALGLWCREQGMAGDSRRHIERAIAINPQHAEARRALGYVRVAGLWIDGRTPASRREINPPDPATEEARLERAVRREWAKRIGGIRRGLLESRDGENVARGRQRILEIRDPLAIPALADVLSRGTVEARLVMVDALASFPDDEATLNLGITGLVDPDEQVRRAALAALKPRDDPRVAVQYIRALRVRSDVLIKRAALALGELRALGAVPDLIELLTEVAVREVEVPVREYFEIWPRDYYRGIDGGPVQGIQVGDYRPISVYIYADQTLNVWDVRQVRILRTEVREALVKITAQDFGFEQDRWRQWLYEQQLQSPAAGPSPEGE